MIVSEHDREGSGRTVQFMDATGDKELIISAWPYSRLDLALGRLGEPSGKSDQPDHLEIVDVMRDDLFTVLFQKNGVRYAVVTLPEDEPGSPTSSRTGSSLNSDAANGIRDLLAVAAARTRNCASGDICVTRDQFAEAFGNQSAAAGRSKQRGSARSNRRRIRECGTRGHCNVYHSVRNRTNHITPSQT